MGRRAAILIPTLNEGARIGALLAQLARLPDDLVLNIVVADGGSTDATHAEVATAAAKDARIRLIDNPARIQSAGVNRAAAAADARADTLVRIDAHALYPDDYVPRILAAFDATGAQMIAVCMETRGETCLQRGIAAAQNSRIGSGGSAHRIGGAAGFVDHGHHAGMDRAAFHAAGGYDESFVANEDAELDARIRQARGRIWLAADIRMVYFPRATLGGLFRQYRRYGQGRAMTWLKHGERLRPRQMLPPLLVLAVALALPAALLWPGFLAVPLAYLALIGVATLALFARAPSPCTLLAAPAIAVMHVAWGYGFARTAASGVTARPRVHDGSWQARGETE